jgi:hypothetical protein
LLLIGKSPGFWRRVLVRHFARKADPRVTVRLAAGYSVDEDTHSFAVMELSVTCNRTVDLTRRRRVVSSPFFRRHLLPRELSGAGRAFGVPKGSV